MCKNTSTIRIATPYDLRRKIEEAIKSIPDLHISGGGSMVVPPYTADISVSIGSKDFFIRIDKTPT